MAAKTFHPDDLFARYCELRNSVSDEEFFCKPGMTRVREMWCAAHFARAFNRYIATCLVVIDEVDAQDDVDFGLSIDGALYPFQVAEVMEPGRRRSAEYKNFTPGPPRQEDWGRGAELGAEWIRQPIDKKLDKRYSRTPQLNLLLYLNFAAYDLQYVNIRDHSLAAASKFASTWLLNGNTLACLSSHLQLRSFEGWLPIAESLYDDPQG